MEVNSNLHLSLVKEEEFTRIRTTNFYMCMEENGTLETIQMIGVKLGAKSGKKEEVHQIVQLWSQSGAQELVMIQM